MKFPGDFSDHVLPEHTHNINLSFIVNSFDKHRGGTAGNMSYTLGLLQTPHFLYAYAGKDFDEYRDAFEKLGIDLKGVYIDETDKTATGFALADKSQNQIWGFYYGAAAKSAELKLDTVANKNDLVIVGPQGAAGSLAFIKQSIALEIPYLFDPGFILTQITAADLEFGVKGSKYVIGNEYEIELMKKRIASWDDITKDKIVITTLGEHGSTIKSEGKDYRISPTIPLRVSTTAGAGDAWRGGFLAGLERKFDLQICGQMGSVAASYAVENTGTQEHAYTKEEFIERYKNSFNQDLSL
jgi:adenosine kinase